MTLPQFRHRRLLLPGSASSGSTLLARSIYADATGKLVLPTEARTTTGYARNSDGVYEAFGSGVPLIVGARKDGSDYYATDTEGADLDPAPSVLTCPGATNSCAYSQDISQTGWTTTGLVKAQDETDIFGNANSAWTIEDDNGSGFESARYSLTVPDDSNTASCRIWIKKTTSATNFPMFRMRYQGGTAILGDVVVDTDNGTLVSPNSPDDSSITSDGDLWRITLSFANNGTGNTTLEMYVFPAVNGDASTSQVSSTTGSCVIDQAEIHLNSVHDVVHALPPIPTSGSAVTTDPTEVSIDWPSGLVNDFVVIGTLNQPVLNNGGGVQLYKDASNYFRVYSYAATSMRMFVEIAGSEYFVSDAATLSVNTDYSFRALKTTSKIAYFSKGAFVGEDADGGADVVIPANGKLDFGKDAAQVKNVTLLRDIQVWTVPAGISDAAVLALTP